MLVAETDSMSIYRDAHLRAGKRHSTHLAAEHARDQDTLAPPTQTIAVHVPQAGRSLLHGPALGGSVHPDRPPCRSEREAARSSRARVGLRTVMPLGGTTGI